MNTIETRPSTSPPPSTSHSRVSKEDLREQLEIMQQKVIDPVVGLYGPESMLWEVNRHTTVFFGAGRASLLQLAHPWVAQGITHHSKTQTDPIGRFRRTFINVFKMVYGDLDLVLDSSIHVHNIHRSIAGKLSEGSEGYKEGSSYMANQVDALIWVHATLWETSVKMFEIFNRQLTLEEKNRYYEETKLFAYLFGIPDSALPPNWNEFLEYNQTMWDSDHLAVGDVGRELAHFIFNINKVLSPMLNRHELHTSMMLNDRLREDFRLPENNDKNIQRFERDVAMVKKWLPRLPKHMRYIPTYLEAEGRLKGKQPNLLTRLSTRAMLGVPRLVT